MFARRHTVQSNAPMLRYNTSLSLSCARYCIRCDVRCWHWSHRFARQLHYLHAVCNTHYIQVPRALFLFQFVPVPGVYTVYDVHANFYLQSPVTWRCEMKATKLLHFYKNTTTTSSKPLAGNLEARCSVHPKPIHEQAVPNEGRALRLMEFRVRLRGFKV